MCSLAICPAEKAVRQSSLFIRGRERGQEYSALRKMFQTLGLQLSNFLVRAGLGCQKGNEKPAHCNEE